MSSLGEVKCPVTGQLLYTVGQDGQLTNHASYGICEECKNVFSESALWFPDGTEPSRWVVRYHHLQCRTCHGTDTSPEQPAIRVAVPRKDRRDEHR